MIGILTGKQIISYMGLPRFKVRLEEIFTGGFQYISYFMALVYSAVNLLPTSHPYTRAENIGKFGIRHVIAEAANNLVMKKENADQIILFIVLLVGLVLIFMQICLLGAAMFMQPVLAAMPTNFAGFFLTPTATETTDIAHIMMDLVFGVSDGTNHLFNSCVAQGVTCTESLPSPATGTRDVMVDSSGASIYAPLGFPFPIHTAMHQMFQIYNTGLLVVAMIIACYFMVTVVVETAQTGTPFGRRFNKVWAPLRIVFAIGMLVPIGIGFNGSQWAVLYAAKFGSGFATNSWNYFNATITGGYFGDAKNLVSTPNVPEISTLIQFFYTARTCKYLEEYSTQASDPKDIQMYAVRGANNASGTQFLLIPDLGTGNPAAYQALITFIEESSSVKFVLGEQHPRYSRFDGSIFPYCGEITMKLTDSRDPSAGDVLSRPEAGTLMMQQYYFFVLRELWYRSFDGPLTGGQDFPENLARVAGPWNRDMSLPLADAAFKSMITNYYRNDLESAMVSCATSICAILGHSEGAIVQLQNSNRYDVNNMITEKGWAGAAIWYNRIAEMNGAVTSAVLNMPSPSKYPSIMEHVLTEKKKFNNNVPFDTRFHPSIRNGEPIQFQTPEQQEIADVLWQAFKFWQESGAATPHASPTGNAMIDSINALFGTEGLYNIRRNPDTHPLAQIVGIGRGLVEAAIRNLTISVVGGVTGNLLSFMAETPANMIKIMSTFLITVTMVSLTAGFILFYVVPFLPFIYFFFAIGGWIKGIFEAMVGAPLWALAHIRIDQDGLPGQAGVAGYFLIFEIFLRPILMIFGMLASISIFSALVTVLNQVFDIVTANVGGFDYRGEQVKSGNTVQGGASVNLKIASTLDSARSAIDEFFFTIIYTIIIYLMAMSSFKLIDLIPNNILRWMGQSTATFNDQREDAAQGLVGKATVGSQQTSGALGSGLKKLAG